MGGGKSPAPPTLDEVAQRAVQAASDARFAEMEQRQQAREKARAAVRATMGPCVQQLSAAIERAAHKGESVVEVQAISRWPFTPKYVWPRELAHCKQVAPTPTHEVVGDLLIEAQGCQWLRMSPPREDDRVLLLLGRRFP